MKCDEMKFGVRAHYQIYIRRLFAPLSDLIYQKIHTAKQKHCEFN